MGRTPPASAPPPAAEAEAEEAEAEEAEKERPGGERDAAAKDDPDQPAAPTARPQRNPIKSQPDPLNPKSRSVTISRAHLG